MDNRPEGAADAAQQQPASLVYRQSAWTRATHWIWAVSLFFLLLTGLQIFNAHPTLYLGDQSGFGFDNEVLADLRLSALGQRSRPAGLATGRVIHFFFAWILSGTLLVWLVAGLANGHIRRNLAPRVADLRRLPHDVARPSEAEIPSHQRVQHAAKTRLCRRAVRALPPDDPDRPRHVALDERGGSLPRRRARRPPDRAHDPFRRHAALGRLLPHPHADDPGRRPDQRAPVHRHRLVSRRWQIRQHRSGVDEMPKIHDQPPQVPDRLDGRRRLARLRLRCVRFPWRQRQLRAQFHGRRQRPDLSRAEAACRPRCAGAGVFRIRHSPAAAPQRRYRTRRRDLQEPAARRFRRLASGDRGAGRASAQPVARAAHRHARPAPRSPVTIAWRDGAASPNGPACRCRSFSTRRR